MEGVSIVTGIFSVTLHLSAESSMRCGKLLKTSLLGKSLFTLVYTLVHVVTKVGKGQKSRHFY